MFAHLGVPVPQEGLAGHMVEAGRSVMIFFTLDLGQTKTPHAIEHSLHVLDDKGETHDISLAACEVIHRQTSALH